MPYASDKQRRYFHYLKNKGKLPKSINLKEYDESTDFEHLPEKAKPKFSKLRKAMK